MDSKLENAIKMAELLIFNPSATSTQILSAIKYVDSFKNIEASENIRHVLGEIRGQEHLKLNL